MNEQLPDVLPGPDSKPFEQADYFDAHPEQITPAHLNNFRLWLPGSSYLAFIDKHMDIPRSGSADHHSGTWLHQTPRQFAHAVQEALATMSDIQEAIREGLTGKDLNARLVPLYLAMRKLGYTHYDLVV